MFSHYNIAVSLLVYLLFVVIIRGEEKEKDMIVDDIIKFNKAEAHVMIGDSTNEVLETKNMDGYDFNNIENSKNKLKNTDINVLKYIRTVQNRFIYCTYAHIAFQMLEQLQGAYNQLDELSDTDKKIELLPFIGQLVETSNILWRKAISAVYSTGIKLDQWFWQILIYTNTTSQVTKKKFPGMSETIPNEILIKRVVHVQTLLREWLQQASQNCKQLKSEVPWNLVVKHDHFPNYPQSILDNNDQHIKTCSEKIKSEVCDSHFKYVKWFEKFLFRNNFQNILTYEKYEMFNPEKWLITSPILEKMFFNKDSTNISWKNIKTDLDFYVNCTSNDDWALNYPNIYFDTVSDLLIAVQQATIQEIRRNWIICQKYWISMIENDKALCPKKITAYSNNCSIIKKPVELIIEKMAIENNEVFKKLHQLLTTKFTLYVDSNMAISYTSEVFNSQDLHLILDDKLPNISNFDEHFEEYSSRFLKYAESFPTIHEYFEVFELFKSSYYNTEFN